MTAPAFLYVIELDGAPVAKIGTASSPTKRLKVLSNTAPFRMSFRRVFRFGDRRTAELHERHIIANANQYRDRGEWVSRDEKLDQLLDSCPGEDVTIEFRVQGREGRPRAAAGGTVERKRRLDIQVGPGSSVITGYCGGADAYDAAVVRARLADGYGVEDIAVMDGIPEEFSRAVIFRLEKIGKLHDLVRARVATGASA